MKKLSKKRKIIFFAALAVFLAAVIFVVYILINSYLVKPNFSSYENTSSQMEVALPDNPIDFATLQQQNPDIYAWIKIPNTVINYPVLQSNNMDDDFYLSHDINKKYKFAGSIYSESLNSRDFSDPVTVLYGHNMLNGSMFQNLHKFRDKTFFDQNQYFTVYTPGHILTYEVFAAYKYDSRHILKTFDFTNPQVLAEYFTYIQNPQSMLVNKRPVTLDANSKVLTLSTCIGHQADYRYLVQGVLTDDQQTK